MTIAFFSSPPCRSLSEKKKKTKQNKQTNKQTNKKQNQENETKKQTAFGPFRLKWLQISGRAVSVRT